MVSAAYDTHAPSRGLVPESLLHQYLPAGDAHNPVRLSALGRYDRSNGKATTGSFADRPLWAVLRSRSDTSPRLLGIEPYA